MTRAVARARVGAAAPRVRVQVVNAMRLPVCFLFISPSEAGDWGGDRLGNRSLQPGDVASYVVPAGRIDIKGVDCELNELFVMRRAHAGRDVRLVLR
jgi:hypothetical protein